jgi:hypothetical protein
MRHHIQSIALAIVPQRVPFPRKIRKKKKKKEKKKKKMSLKLRDFLRHSSGTKSNTNQPSNVAKNFAVMRAFVCGGRRFATSLDRVRGMRDEVPADVHRRVALANLARHEMSLFGFSEIATPVVEKKELFVRSLGADSDAVSKELFSIDGDLLALRPENTAGAVRMLVEGAHGR